MIFKFYVLILFVFIQRRKRRRDDKELTTEAATASEAVEAICVQKNKSLNGINLKKLFNESDLADSPIKAPKIVDAFEEILDNVEANEDNVSNIDEDRQEDPHVVNLFHSYAVQSD